MEIGGEVSSRAFVRMLRAYRETFAKAYPKRDAVVVLTVLKACESPTSQAVIAKATRIAAGEVNKVVDRACDEGWLNRNDSRTPGGPKTLTMTKKGQQVFAAFERRCSELCSDSTSIGSSPATSRSRPKKGRPAPATDEDLKALLGEID